MALAAVWQAFLVGGVGTAFEGQVYVGGAAALANIIVLIGAIAERGAHRPVPLADRAELRRGPRAHPLRHGRHDDAGLGRQPRDAVRRARDDVGVPLRPHRPRARGVDGQRERAEVLPAGRLLDGLLPLRPRAPLRRHRHDAAGAAGGRPGADGPDRPVPRGRRAPARRVLLQGVRRPVPHVDARRVPGRPDLAHGVHVDGLEGRDVRARSPSSSRGRSRRTSSTGRSRSSSRSSRP